MTKEQWAEKLNGREYGSELLKGEKETLWQDRMVIVYGYSDDNMEFNGLMNDEVPCYGGGEVFVTKGCEIYPAEHECECDFCGFENMKKASRKIEALWCKEKPYSWTYKTDIPHACFEIMEDGEKFCRRIVFSVEDL